MSTDISIPQTGREVRSLIRAGLFRQPTSGVAPHHVQANVAILPKEMAFEFLLFCQRNPKPCPVIEVIESGEVEASLTATGSDITKDVPLYRVYKHGKMVDEPETLESYWRDDLVTFLLGCSFSFEHALMANGIDLPYYGTKRNVPMFITNIETEKSGPFAGPMVVSHRWIPQNKLVQVGLTYIYGIGDKFSRQICQSLEIPKNKRVHELTDEQILKIREYIDQKFSVEGDLRRETSLNIKRLIDLATYRGSRHRKKLPVRGQRTRCNARTRKGKAIAIAGKKLTPLKK